MNPQHDHTACMKQNEQIDSALITLRAHLRCRFRGREDMVKAAFADLAERLTTAHAHETVARIRELGLLPTQQ
jgi:hypothetical protein